MSNVPLGLLLQVADVLVLPLATVHAIVDTHQADEDDVRASIAAVLDRVVRATNPPHALQLLHIFESALPTWQPSEEVGSWPSNA